MMETSNIPNTDRLLLIVDQTRAKVLLIYLGFFFAVFSGNIGGALTEMLPFGGNGVDDENRNVVILSTFSFIGIYVSARHLVAGKQLKKIAPEIYTWRSIGNILDFSGPRALAWIMFVPTAIFSIIIIALFAYFIPVGIWRAL